MAPTRMSESRVYSRMIFDKFCILEMFLFSQLNTFIYMKNPLNTIFKDYKQQIYFCILLNVFIKKNWRELYKLFDDLERRAPQGRRKYWFFQPILCMYETSSNVFTILTAVIYMLDFIFLYIIMWQVTTCLKCIHEYVKCFLILM